MVDYDERDGFQCWRVGARWVNFRGFTGKRSSRGLDFLPFPRLPLHLGNFVVIPPPFLLLVFPLLLHLPSLDPSLRFQLDGGCIHNWVIGAGWVETIDGSRIDFILRGIFRVRIEPLEQVFKVSVLFPCDPVGVLGVLRSDTEHVEFVMHLYNMNMTDRSRGMECILP